MDESKHNSAIENIANMLINDNISADEQDISKLEKYKEQAKSEYNLDDNESMNIIYESLLYMKMKTSDSIDPLQQGDQFGAGFS